MKNTESVSVNESANFKSVTQFCQDNTTFPKGGVRHMIFRHGPKLIAEGAIHKYGDRIIINQKRWFELLEAGYFANPEKGAQL